MHLEDLGSQEGTFCNGRQLLGLVQVFLGDRIGFGSEVVLILQGDDPTAEQSLEEDLGLSAQESPEA